MGVYLLAGHRADVVQRESGHENLATTLAYAKEVQDRGDRYGLPFAPLSSALVAVRDAKVIGPIAGPAGSQPLESVVGEAGFEPAISSTQSLRTTGLCYSPSRTQVS